MALTVADLHDDLVGADEADREAPLHAVTRLLCLKALLHAVTRLLCLKAPLHAVTRLLCLQALNMHPEARFSHECINTRLVIR